MSPRTQGALVRRPKKNALRTRAWAQMRIHKKGFSVRDIVSVVDGMSRAHLEKWLPSLIRHKIVIRLRRIGKNGEAGSYVLYRLMGDVGPMQPTVCPRCGGSLAKPCEEAA